jgi:hypothetical protein
MSSLDTHNMCPIPINKGICTASINYTICKTGKKKKAFSIHEDSTFSA